MQWPFLHLASHPSSISYHAVVQSMVSGTSFLRFKSWPRNLAGVIQSLHTSFGVVIFTTSFGVVISTLFFVGFFFFTIKSVKDKALTILLIHGQCSISITFYCFPSSTQSSLPSDLFLPLKYIEHILSSKSLYLSFPSAWISHSAFGLMICIIIRFWSLLKSHLLSEVSVSTILKAQFPAL